MYALKSMRKLKLIDLKQVEHAINEKRILAAINHPFLNQLVSVMCDEDPEGEVHLMLELCLGGELFTLLQQAGCFDLSTATFYSACVVSAMAHLHSRKIVYRDLKPENLVIGKDGYVVVIDFGFAKMLKGGEKTFTLCGTPQYLAPEIVTSQVHTHTHTSGTQQQHHHAPSPSPALSPFPSRCLHTHQGHTFSADWWAYSSASRVG